jgi:hypothetical protein
MQKNDLAPKPMRHAALFSVRDKLGYAACGITKYPNLPRNLLGRQGWLRNLKLGIVDYDYLLYLSAYGS